MESTTTRWHPMQASYTEVESIRTDWLPWRRLLGTRFDSVGVLETVGTLSELIAKFKKLKVGLGKGRTRGLMIAPSFQTLIV